MDKYLRRGCWAIGGMTLAVVMIGAALVTPRVLADTASGTDDITLTLDVACTVSSTVTIPHDAPDMHVGQHKVDIGNTDISLFCNDNNGYSVYAIGNSGDMDGATDLVSDISNSYNIHTGTNTTGNSAWAMKLTAGTGSASETTPPTIVNGYDSYSAVPDVYTQVAKRTSGTSAETNTKVSGSYFSTTYSIYTAGTQPAGSYAGKVKYVMVHPSSNATTIPDIDAAFAAKGKKKAYQDASGNYYYSMQDMSSDICASVTRTGESTTARLVDVRDNKLYYVTKLKDGHCWMTQNLDLDIGGAGTLALTSENTDISTTASGKGIYADGYGVSDGVYTWTPDSTAVTSGRSINFNAGGNPPVSGWTNDHNEPYSAEGGDTYFYTSDTTGADTKYTSLTDCERDHSDCVYYHVGNYYNWTAAIASNASNGISSNYTNADNSICPKNWRLPVGDNSGSTNREFGKLLASSGIIATATTSGNDVYSTDGFNKMRTSPLYFVRSGYVNGSNLSNSGSNGYYWSSTVYTSISAYYLNFSSTGVWPSNSSDRSRGRSVRCMAR